MLCVLVLICAVLNIFVRTCAVCFLRVVCALSVNIYYVCAVGSFVL